MNLRQLGRLQTIQGSLASLGISAPGQNATRIIGKLPNGRPIIRNADGSISTHRNIIAGIDGWEYLLPTLYGGQEVDEEEAVAIARQSKGIDPDTGLPFPRFLDVQSAERAEQELHKYLAEIGLMTGRSR